MDDKKDFADYLEKSSIAPDPLKNPEVWLDDPAARTESYIRSKSELLKNRKKLLKRKKK